MLSMICKELVHKPISLNSMTDNTFFSAHAPVIQISLLYFLKTEQAIPKANHMRP